MGDRVMLSWHLEENSSSRISECGNYKITGVKIFSGAEPKDDSWRYVAWKLTPIRWEMLEAYDTAKEAKARCDEDMRKVKT